MVPVRPGRIITNTHEELPMNMFRNRYRMSSLRFRRWSRHAYAAFCSIGRHVTIGHLTAGIADASLRKEKSVHTAAKAAFLLSSVCRTGAEPDDDAPPGLVLCEICTLPAVAGQSDIQSAGDMSPCSSVVV